MALRAVGLTTHIANNNIKSVLLLIGFPVLLLAMMFAFFALTGMGGYTPDYGHGYGAAQAVPAAEAMVNAGIAGVSRYGVYAFIAAAVWFTIAFFANGRMIASASGARPISRKEMPKIYNMLENMCISRGLAMPKFYVIDSPALNAFASGINEKTYAITLTRGIIEALEDDELEAVIGHELTHIMNRDVRLLIISVVFVGMISFLCEWLFRVMVHGGRSFGYARGRGDNRGGGALVLLIGLAVLAVGYVFAILIRFALSRRREFMADAGAVELTKNPSAMMRALMRISGKDQVKGMPDEIQQMCIENSHRFMGMFATHPPIDARIAAISRITNEPIPALGVSLKRPPRRPWDRAAPPTF